MTEVNNEFITDSLKASILIVDDEPVNVLLLEKILASKGYSNVVSTNDPTQTLPLYLKHKSDLVLLDINMPVMDGYDVMEELNNEIRKELAPILVLTAQHTQSFRQRALDKVHLIMSLNHLMQMSYYHEYIIY